MRAMILEHLTEVTADSSLNYTIELLAGDLAITVSASPIRVGGRASFGSRSQPDPSDCRGTRLHLWLTARRETASSVVA